MGRKVGGGAAVPLSMGELCPPSSTMWPGLRPTNVSSGILIHPTVWLQYTNVTDSTTGQDAKSVEIYWGAANSRTDLSR